MFDDFFKMKKGGEEESEFPVTDRAQENMGVVSRNILSLERRKKNPQRRKTENCKDGQRPYFLSFWNCNKFLES